MPTILELVSSMDAVKPSDIDPDSLQEAANKLHNYFKDAVGSTTERVRLVKSVADQDEELIENIFSLSPGDALGVLRCYVDSWQYHWYSLVIVCSALTAERILTIIGGTDDAFTDTTNLATKINTAMGLQTSIKKVAVAHPYLVAKSFSRALWHSVRYLTTDKIVEPEIDTPSRGMDHTLREILLGNLSPAVSRAATPAIAAGLFSSGVGDPFLGGESKTPSSTCCRCVMF